MPALLGSQKVSRPPDFQVPHGNLKPASQVGILTDGGKTLLRHFPEYLIPPVH